MSTDGDIQPGSGVGVGMAAVALSVTASIGVVAITIPLLVAELGKDGFGVWTLLFSAVLFLTLAETGFGPAVQRFSALARGAGDPDAIRRLGWTVVALYSGVGLVILVLAVALAPTLLAPFDLPAELRPDAERALRIVGIALPLVLAQNGFGSLMLGLERTAAMTRTLAAGSVLFLVGVIVVDARDAGLVGVATVLLAQQAFLVLARLWLLRDVLQGGRPATASGDELRALWRFSLRLQVSALTVLINSQSDKIVVGLVAPAATLGQLGVASQVAESGRIVLGTALLPVTSRLATHVGAGDHEQVRAVFERINAAWLVGVGGGVLVAMGTVGPLIRAWLGPGFGLAEGLAVALVLAYGINVLAGICAAYLRATNRIGLEARAGVIIVALNVMFTVPLAMVAGATGVVLGTLAAYVLGTAWFFARVHRIVPLVRPGTGRELGRAAALGLLTGAIAFEASHAAADALPRYVALVPVVLTGGLVLLAYLVVAFRVPLRPDALRAAVASLRG